MFAHNLHLCRHKIFFEGNPLEKTNNESSQWRSREEQVAAVRPGAQVLWGRIITLFAVI